MIDRSLEIAFNNKSALEQLDSILVWLSEGRKIFSIKTGEIRGIEFFTIVVDDYEFDKSDIISSAVIKLVNDGLVRKLPISNTTSSCAKTAIILTFEGRVKLESGGYVGSHKKDVTAERRFDIQTKLTWILAIGVITPSFWYLFDIIEKFYNKDAHVGAYVIVGTAAAITLYIVFRSKLFRGE